MTREKPVIYLADGGVRTLDPARPLAPAFAVRGRQVLAVGSETEVRHVAGNDAEVVRLRGTVVPGLVDAHGHILGLGRALLSVQLLGARSASEAARRVKDAPPTSYEGDWLVGRGWNQNDWVEDGLAFPHRRLLDEHFPAVPVAMSRVDGHALWVNSEALRRGRIDRGTPDPAGGRIVRDGGGEPTGVLIDNAMDLLRDVLPKLTDAQRQERLGAAFKRLVSVGLTEVHDAGMDFDTFTLLQQWDAVGLLPIRVYAMAAGQDVDAAPYLERGPFTGRLLTLRSVKFYLDGALGSRGAALHRPYSDDPAHSGLLLLTPEEFAARAHRFIERGFQINVHAIGDRANTLALDFFETLTPEQRTTLRPRVEHAQVVRREDLPRFGRLGVIASMQPSHCTSDMEWADERLGPDRLPGAYPWKSLADSGARLAFGSDFPVEDPNPLHGLYSAITRQDPKGHPPGGFLPQERLGAEEALRGFTEGAAYAAFAETSRGRIAAGRDADFTVLSVDPVTAAPGALRDAEVRMTVVAGAKVFER